jgi:hypothetical protein
MNDRGFKRPLDVWFDNIIGILELNMDPDLKWIEILSARIYPDDAMSFIVHTQSFYLTICSPSDKTDEFLLTQNAYSMHERPVSHTVNPITGKVLREAYAEFHVFAPIAPRLIFVLRNLALPDPLEDADSAIGEWRESLLRELKLQHNHPESISSMLEDLPVNKALNSYSKVVNGKLVPIGEGPKGATDGFCFRFFPITTTHVNKINSLMLEESYKSSLIVFKSEPGARKMLENYLKDAGAFNVLDPVGNHRRRECIKKLKRAATLLGSNIAPPGPTESSGTEPEISGLGIDKVLELFRKDEKATLLYKEFSRTPPPFR